MESIDINTHAVAPEATRVEALDWVVIPSIVLLALTIAGALMILCSMAWLEYRGRPATTRTRLVQALVLSDLVLGIVGLIGNVLEISPGHRLTAGTATCDGLGFMLIAVLWTEHMWTLCLAIGTYLILIHPLHNMTLILEKHWIWLWALVWVFAIIIAIITQTVYGFTPSGGICYYPQSAGLYGELMQFIPRAMVFICITLLYARLYVFLKRPDKIRSPYSNSPTGQSYDSSYKKKATGFLRKLSGDKESPAEQGDGTGNNGGHGEGTGVGVVDFAKPTPTAPELGRNPSEFNRNNRPVFNSALSATKFPDASYRPPSAPVSPMSEIPPWERIELPVFQVDGQRYGGPSASTKTEMFGGWKGMNSKKRPSTANSTGSNPQTPMPMPFPRGSVSHSHKLTRGSDGTETTRSRQPSSETTLVSDRNTDKERTRKTSMMTTASNTSSTNYSHLNSNQGNGLNYVHSRRPSAAPPHASPVMEIDNEDFLRSRSDRGGDEESRRQSRQDDEEEEEDEEEESDGEMDLMRMLAQDSEPVDNQRRGSREEYELVPESMASYLNRKTALLMLWFPLGYVMLFSISLIRVIYDFAGRPPTVLRAMSRWFVFAQGVLDAVIYGLVEWHTKRVVRRRLRKGAMTPGQSRTGGSFGGVQASGIGSAIRAMSGFKKSKNDPTQSQSQSQTQSRHGQGQSQGYGQDSQLGVPSRFGYPSIMQELELDTTGFDDSRKGSVATSDGKKVEGEKDGI